MAITNINWILQSVRATLNLVSQFRLIQGAHLMTNQLSMAKRMINASICAYQIHNHGWTPASGSIQPLIQRTIAKDANKPDKGYYYAVTPLYQDPVGFVDTAANGYAPEFIAIGKEYINAALVGATNDNKIVLSIRGTIPPSFENNDIFQWIDDWLQDFDIPPKTWWPYKLPFRSDVKVEKGFGAAMTALWPFVKTMMDNVIKAHSSCDGVIITGHSKGAGMTFLAATLVEYFYPQFKNNIEVHAFAAPVVGNAEFVSHYNTTGLGSQTHRYQVENDLVPFLPFWSSEDVFGHIIFKGWKYEAAWLGIQALVSWETEGGYEAVGDYTYFNSSHNHVIGAKVDNSALPAVVKSLKEEKFKTIAAAHSAVTSYLPCFP